MASFIYLGFAPVERGGRGDFKDKVEREVVSELVVLEGEGIVDHGTLGVRRVR